MVQVPSGERADSVRAEEALGVEHAGENAPQLVLVDERQQATALHAGLERIRDVGEQVPVPLDELQDLSGQPRGAFDDALLDDGRGAQRQQADQGPHLEPSRAPVGQPKHVVEEPVFFVPQLVGVLADRVDGRRDPEEVLDELEHELLVARVVV